MALLQYTTCIKDILLLPANQAMNQPITNQRAVNTQTVDSLICIQIPPGVGLQPRMNSSQSQFD